MSGTRAGVQVLGVVGAALPVLGLLSWKRVRATLPNTDRLLISRGPGLARGGIVMVAGLAIVLGGSWPRPCPGSLPGEQQRLSR